MDDAHSTEKGYPLAAAKMSKTPSWIMVGFVLGAAFVAALPPFSRDARQAKRSDPAAIEPPAMRGADQPRAPLEPPPVSTIEAVFATWGRYAVWFDDTTEVALWNPAENAFSEFYEVRRFGPTCYFRTLPSLTRRTIVHAKPPAECPLQFTETDEQHREWLERNGAIPGAIEARPSPPRFAPPPATNRVAPAIAPLAPPQLPAPRSPGDSPSREGP